MNMFPKSLFFVTMSCQLVIVFLSVMCAAKGIGKPTLAADTPRPIGKIPPDLSIENLQLGDTSSRRGRTTQGPLVAVTTTTTPHPVIENSDTVLYQLNNRDEKACILILSDAIVEIDFVTNLKEKREVSVFVPAQFKASGKCDAGDDAQFKISWTNFAWTIFFSKTPGGDHWYVEKMTVDADTQDKHLAHINRPPSILHFESTNKGAMMYPTPVGKSFACDEELSVALTDGDINAKVLLRKLKMQPFIFKNDFGPEHSCTRPGAKSYRDETAPIAVGSTLAVCSVLTVAGYGVYRYMKVKKVQYGTME